MTDNKQIAPIPVGGNVTAIVPQDLAEITRIAKGVVQAGLAPEALIKNKDAGAQVSAVVIVIMSGAELGIPPMAALRSFTVINGRPALYGDGLINVIRRSGKAKKLKIGFEPGKSAQFGNDAYGYCIAERSDTGETDEVRFTVDEAKRAGLWDEREELTRRDGSKYRNDTPWKRYPQRMLSWRAAGYCLRSLFGDVLGGITDEYEARESVPYAEFTEVSQDLPASAPVAPPAEDTSTSVMEEPPRDMSTVEARTTFLDELDNSLRAGTSEDLVMEIWDASEVDYLLKEKWPDAYDQAEMIRDKHIVRAKAQPAEETGNG